MGWEQALVVFLMMLTAQIPVLIVAIVAYFRALAAAVKIDETALKVEEVHIATNSMKDELVRTVALAERAKGILEGAAQEKAKAQAQEKAKAQAQEKAKEE